MKSLNNDSFDQLQSILTDLSPDGTNKKIQLLKQCSLLKITSAKLIQRYHNSLLFLLSYAESEEVNLSAQQEMNRLTDSIKKSKTLKEKLIGSGIAGTRIQGAYSLTLLNWMLNSFGSQITLHSFDERGVNPREIVKTILPETEFELANDESLKPIKWLEKVCGTKNKHKILIELVGFINQLEASELLKDQLFESLKLFVEIEPKENAFSRSYGKIRTTKHFFHTEGILKKFDEHEVISKKLPPEKKLTKEEKSEIINCSRVALCLLNRETDPITYCEELNIKYFELERGLSIALFSIDAERRLPFESYIGFMMFKNGYPMSYGGAWLFGERSLIGINIFEAFRGGESAIVFAQLLRCYKMAFGATYFEVEPYQFGKNNPEGIQSGAFWFYYRFGFKPCDKMLNELALSEHHKIISTKGYRTSPEILRQFTRSNLFVHFTKSTAVPLSPENISKFITQKIKEQFNGDRLQANKWCLQKLKQEKIISKGANKIGLQKLGTLFALCLDWRLVSEKEKIVLRKLIVTKSESEFEYIYLLSQFNLEKHMVSEFWEKYPKLR